MNETCNTAKLSKYPQRNDCDPLVSLKNLFCRPFQAVRSACHPTIEERFLLFLAALDFLLNILFHGCVDFLFPGMRAVLYLGVVLSRKPRENEGRNERAGERTGGRRYLALAEFETRIKS